MILAAFTCAKCRFIYIKQLIGGFVNDIHAGFNMIQKFGIFP